MKHNQQLGKLRSYFPHNEPNKEPAVFDIFRRGLESKQVRWVKLMHLHLWGFHGASASTWLHQK